MTKNKPMKAIDKAMIEIKMFQYFDEFSKDGLTVSIFKDRQETPAENGGVYLSLPEYDTNYYSEFFDEFFTKKLNENKRPYESFIKTELKFFKHHFNVLSNDIQLNIIDDWIDYLNRMLSIDKTKTNPIGIKKTDLDEATPANHLKELFKDEAHYKKIIDILIEHNFIEAKTLIWKDEKGAKKQFVAGLIKVLYNKGYLMRSAKNFEIPAISLNTFNVKLSQSIAEKTKVEKADQNYKNIPTVDELQ